MTELSLPSFGEVLAGQELDDWLIEHPIAATALTPSNETHYERRKLLDPDGYGLFYYVEETSQGAEYIDEIGRLVRDKPKIHHNVIEYVVDLQTGRLVEVNESKSK